MTGRSLMFYLSNLYRGDWEDIYDHISRKIPLEVSGDEIDEMAKNSKCQFVTLIDPNYPVDFKKMMERMPFVLYYIGDFDLLFAKYRLSVIGSRDATSYGIKSTREAVSKLPKEVVIISGMARGIDRAAMEEALDQGHKVIAVLGCGVDVVYPKENKDIYDRIIASGGLILSEYPLGCEPAPDQFKKRNRIVAAIGQTLLLGEGYGRSGTRVTINYALTYGKTVCAIPYPYGTSSICNEVIKQGATLVDNEEDLLEAIGYQKFCN